jgi:hypothetical protein
MIAYSILTQLFIKNHYMFRPSNWSSWHDTIFKSDSELQPF